jgi:hypothetical protein
VQLSGGPESSEHRKVEPLSLDAKSKLAVVEVVVLGGRSAIDVSGGEVSAAGDNCGGGPAGWGETAGVNDAIGGKALERLTIRAALRPAFLCPAPRCATVVAGNAIAAQRSRRKSAPARMRRLLQLPRGRGAN